MSLLNRLPFVVTSVCFIVFGFGESGRFSAIASCILLPLILIWKPSTSILRIRKSWKASLLFLTSIIMLALCILIFVSRQDSKMLLSLISNDEIRVLGVLIAGITVAIMTNLGLIIVSIYSLSFGLITNSIVCLSRTLSTDPSMLLMRKIYGIWGDERHVVSVTNSHSIATVTIVCISLFLYFRLRKYKLIFLALSLASIISLVAVSVYTLTRTGFFIALFSTILFTPMLVNSFHLVVATRSKTNIIITKTSLVTIAFIVLLIFVALYSLESVSFNEILEKQLTLGLEERFTNSGEQSNIGRIQHFNDGINEFILRGNFGLIQGNNIFSSSSVISPFFHNFIFDMTKTGGLVGLILSLFLISYLLLPLLKLRSILFHNYSFMNSHGFFWVLPIPGFVSALIFLNSIPIEEGGTGWMQFLLAIISSYFCQWILDSTYCRAPRNMSISSARARQKSPITAA